MWVDGWMREWLGDGGWVCGRVCGCVWVGGWVGWMRRCMPYGFLGGNEGCAPGYGGEVKACSRLVLIAWAARGLRPLVGDREGGPRWDEGWRWIGVAHFASSGVNRNNITLGRLP